MDVDKTKASKSQQNDKKRKAAEEQSGEEDEEEEAFKITENASNKKQKTQEGQTPSAEQSNKLFVGNLSFQITDDSIKEFFKDCGEISHVAWNSDKQTGKFYGTGFLEFTTLEGAKKAVAKNGQDCLGRPIKIEFCRPRADRPDRGAGGRGGRGGAGAGAGRAERPPSQKEEGCVTVFVGNLPFDIDEDGMKNFFSDCGEVAALRWVEKDGQFKGCGFVEFTDSSATDKAVAKSGQSLKGRTVRVDFASGKPKRNF
jgi:nucleolin